MILRVSKLWYCYEKVPLPLFHPLGWKSRGIAPVTSTVSGVPGPTGHIHIQPLGAFLWPARALSIADYFATARSSDTCLSLQNFSEL